MTELHDQIADLFARFDRAHDGRSLQEVVEAFHDPFLSLDPAHVATVPRATLLAALPARDQLFGSIGGTGLGLDTFSERPLDDDHCLVDATWSVRFSAAGQQPMRLRTTYLLRREDGQWRIVVYLNHHDIAAEIALRRSASAS